MPRSGWCIGFSREMSAHLSFYDGITTADIQQTLIRSASDLISLEAPNYQFVAARLLLFQLRKSINGRKWENCTRSTD